MTDIFDFIGLKNMTTSQDYLPNLNEQEWIMSMQIDEILNIQKAVSIYFLLNNVIEISKHFWFQHNCLHIMKVLGYRPFTGPDQIGVMNPVTPKIPTYKFDYDIWPTMFLFTYIT